MRDDPGQLQELPAEDLVRAACAGDHDAFGAVFRLLYGRVHRTVWGILGDEAEAHDVAQESWIKAWERRARFNFTSTFSTWVHRIAVNTALDALRRRSRLRRRFRSFLGGLALADRARELPAGEPGPDRQLEQRELGRAIAQAVEALPEEQRVVLVLREFEDYSYEEIARAVGCQPGTVMSRLHLARKKLQNHLSRIPS